MITRITAGAILTHGTKVLLLKRALHKKLAPGLWAGIGGHMELTDITNPRALDLIETCRREVFEETGIASIKNLSLRYIAVRKTDGEIRWNHHFIGELMSEIPLPACDEGELHWVEKTEIPQLSMSSSVTEIFRHWMIHPHANGIYLVVMNEHDKMQAVLKL